MTKVKVLARVSNDDGITATQQASDFLENNRLQLVSFRSVRLRGQPVRAEVIGQQRK